MTARLPAAAETVGVEVAHFGAASLDPIVEMALAGNRAQIASRAFRTELKHWLRFNPRAAVGRRDGLFSASSGNPTLPDCLGPAMFDLTFDAEAEDRRLAAQMRSSPGVLVLLAPSDDTFGWMAAGRAAERIMLQATVDGLKSAFVNQAVEDPPSRAAPRHS